MKCLLKSYFSGMLILPITRTSKKKRPPFDSKYSHEIYRTVVIFPSLVASPLQRGLEIQDCEHKLRRGLALKIIFVVSVCGDVYCKKWSFCGMSVLLQKTKCAFSSKSTFNAKTTFSIKCNCWCKMHFQGKVHF